jgi:hypothetical protein
MKMMKILCGAFGIGNLSAQPPIEDVVRTVVSARRLEKEAKKLVEAFNRLGANLR